MKRKSKRFAAFQRGKGWCDFPCAQASEPASELCVIGLAVSGQRFRQCKNAKRNVILR